MAHLTQLRCGCGTVQGEADVGGGYARVTIAPGSVLHYLLGFIRQGAKCG